MLYYKEKYIKGNLEKIPITPQDIQRILNESKVIDIESREPFPEGKLIVVGIGNRNYECHVLYDMQYTTHAKLTYGGYQSKDHNENFPWWTMNYTNSDKYDKTKCYIVKNYDDGCMLAKFFNFVGGLENLEKTIQEKEDELAYLHEVRQLINK